MTQQAQKYQNEGLEDAATRHGVFPDARSEFERYREGRDLPAKKTAQSVQAYTPPEAEQEQPVITLTMKRYFACGSVTTAWACFFSMCEHGAFSAIAAPLGFVIAAGCGIAFVLALFRNCFAWSPSAGNCAGGNSKQETHYHYHQYNNQGPGGQQNTNQK